MVERDNGQSGPTDGALPPTEPATGKAVVTRILDELGAQVVKGPVGTTYEVPQEGGDPIRVVLMGNETYEVGDANFPISDLSRVSPDIAKDVVVSDMAHMRTREELFTTGASGASVPSDLRVNEALHMLGARRATGPIGVPYDVGQGDQDRVRVVLINGGRVRYEVNEARFNTERLGKLPTDKAFDVVSGDVDYMRARTALLRPPAAPRGRLPK